MRVYDHQVPGTVSTELERKWQNDDYVNQFHRNESILFFV